MNRLFKLLAVLACAAALPCAAAAQSAPELPADPALQPPAAPADPRSAEPATAVDPYVALDAAKVQLGEGRLEEARRLLALIDPAPAEAYVAEELAYQRMLLDGAFLESTNFLIAELARQKQDGSAYSAWLRGKRGEYAEAFAGGARRYLELTSDGFHCTFVRFRLPLVNEHHLQDVQLYSDPQVLTAAVQNWAEQREGLGKGLILAQARVAVVLAAAVHYDLPTAGDGIEAVAARLAGGVPLYPALTLDWIADVSLRSKAAGSGLEQLSRAADQQVLALTADGSAESVRKRAELRLNPPPPPKPEPPKPAPKKKAKRKRR